MARRGIVCGGSWGVDKNKLINAWPAEEGSAFILEEESQCGGSGANSAIDLRKLEAPFPVEAVGMVGDDADGRFLLALCDTHGIDRTQVHVATRLVTSHTFVMTAKTTGKRTFFHEQGTHALLSPDHFDFSRTGAALLHLGLPGELDRMDAPWAGDASGWVAVLKQARAAGLRTNMELAPIEPGRLGGLVRPCLPHLDYLIINDAEAGEVSGIPTMNGATADIAACERAALALRDMGPAELIVVHFPQGAIAVTRDGTITRQPATRIPREEVKGTVGAGDAFAAGMLIGIHENWPVAQSLALAHASAAASLRALTTTGAIVPWRDCLTLADRWGWRDSMG